MSDDPRSYRVPVLRLTDVSKAAGLTDEHVQDDEFEFRPAQGSNARREAEALEEREHSLPPLPSEPTPVAAYIPGPPRKSISGNLVPPPEPDVPVPPVSTTPAYAGQSTAPERSNQTPIPSAPLPKQADPFARPKNQEPPDLWEMAEMKQQVPPPVRVPRPLPPAPEPARVETTVDIPTITMEPAVQSRTPQLQTPLVTSEPIRQQAPPLHAPLPKQADPFARPKNQEPPDLWEMAEMKQQVPPPAVPVPPQPHREPTPPSPEPAESVAPTYGTTTARQTEPAPEPTVPTISPEVRTTELLNEALQGMGFGEFIKQEPAATGAVPAVNTAPAPTPTVTPAVEHGAATAPGGLSNLASLRNRVLRTMSTQRDARQAPQPTTPSQGTTETTAPPAGEPPAQQTGVGTVPIRRAPDTQHARAIAEVAAALHTIQSGGESLSVPTSLSRSKVPPAAAALVGERPSITPVPHKETLPPFPAGNVPPPQEQKPRIPTAPPRMSGIPMMRTFKTDMERTINKDRVSVSKMIADQETRRHSDQDVTVRTTSRRHFTIGSSVLVFFTVTLLAAAVGFGVFLYHMATRTTPTDTVNSLFFADQSIEHDVTGQDRTALLQGLTKVRDSASLKPGQVLEVVLKEHVVVDGKDTGQTTTITGKDLLSRVNAHAPDTLLRTIQDSFVVGIHEETATAAPFIVLRAGYHENAFTGMLAWENTMDVDLSPFFGAPISHTAPPRWQQPPASAGTSTATATPVTTVVLGSGAPAAPVDTSNLGRFDDATVANISARVLRDTDGAVHLVWAMPDTNTIIITTNTDTLKEIRDRMEAR